MTKYKVINIFHGNCADGFTAAWVVNEHFKQLNKVCAQTRVFFDLELFSGVYSEPVPDVKDKIVIITDFSYDRATMEKIAQDAQQVIILDHHKTAIERLQGIEKQFDNVTVEFDLNRSGARITWDYFFKNQEVPVFIQYVQDRDLWHKKLDNCDAIAAYIFSFEYTLENWDKFYYWDFSADQFNKAVDEGNAILRKQKKDIEELINFSKREIYIEGYKVPVANLPYTLASEAANIMAEGHPFAVCYYDSATHRVFSLRSREDGIDVASLAEKFGGGGHQHAAGFRIELDKLIKNECYYSQVDNSSEILKDENTP